MPPRIQPKTYIISFKTHKLTVLTSVPQPERTTIADLKVEALSALQAEVLRSTRGAHNEDIGIDIAPDIDIDEAWEAPSVDSIDDFELSRALKDRGRMTGHYEVLSAKETVKQNLVNWETVFIQFRDEHGDLLPVKVALPSIADDEEEEVPAPSTSKGKRKAGPQDFMD